MTLAQLKARAIKLGADDLEHSTRKGKKYVVLYRGRVIHFGAKGMSDFTIHKDKARRARYRARHRAILTKEGVQESEVVANYKTNYSNDLVEDWRLIAPELALMQEMYGSMLYVLMFIILTALIFGIVNTMLMAVLERFKELGMLMAIGMNKLRIFLMMNFLKFQ